VRSRGVKISPRVVVAVVGAISLTVMGCGDGSGANGGQETTEGTLTVGETATVFDEDSRKIVSITVASITPDPHCDVPAAPPPLPGHYLLVELRVDMTDSESILGVYGLRRHNFTIRGPDGTIEDSATPTNGTTCRSDALQGAPPMLSPGNAVDATMVFNTCAPERHVDRPGAADRRYVGMAVLSSDARPTLSMGSTQGSG
jgi:hypothetical protein